MNSNRPKGYLLVFLAVAAILLLGGYTMIKDKAPYYFANQTVDIAEVAYPMFTSDSNDEVKTIFQLCSNSKFGKALSAIESLDLVKQSDPRLQFTAGICLMQLEKFDQAKRKFEHVVEGQFPLVTEQAMWYLALTNVKTDQIGKAQKYLKILAGQPNAEFHVHALQLLKELGFDQGTELL